jgi:hypothetical protein
MSVLATVNRLALPKFTSIVKSLSSVFYSSKLSSITEFSSTKYWKAGLAPENENGLTALGLKGLKTVNVTYLGAVFINGRP